MRPVLHAHCARARVRRAVQTDCQIVRERDFKLVGTRVLDLSVRGILISSDLPILTGEDVHVSFKSPLTRRWFDCSGIVARVLHGRRREDRELAASRASSGTLSVGIAFEGLAPWHELLLCDDLARAPVVVRRRIPKFERRALNEGCIG